MNISLGCGKTKPIGWIGIDKRSFPDVDYVLDIGKNPLPFQDNSVNEIRAIHLFEHLTPDELFFSVDECWRVLKPTGLLHIEVPKAGTSAFYAHPDHKIHFMKYTFAFFQVPPDGIDHHGYIKHFWKIQLLKDFNQQKDIIYINMYPALK